ncbi:MAG: hypothetical protein E8D43_07400 [Nitrospira sp.]|nr:MAG: hypothetical protein E8D43_07400 [Nitrospira sp.]
MTSTNPFPDPISLPSFPNRLLKKLAGIVLARHCRLTVSTAFTNVTRCIQRVVNLRSSPYGHVHRACLGRLGVGG